MNYRGSYRQLLRNAEYAMVGAIELYNKPSFLYRDESVVVLLLNGWELLLKAVLSKNGQSIFYRKKRNQPYRTLSWSDALGKARHFLPDSVPFNELKANLELLGTYRDNTVHFYNAKGFGVVVYGLAQTSVVNFRDVLHDAFGKDLGEIINWRLLPIGIAPPIDPVDYLKPATGSGEDARPAVTQFLARLRTVIQDIEDQGGDTGRVLTAFTLKLESVKKVSAADFKVAVGGATEEAGPLAIVKTVDPNVSHPLRQKEILAAIQELAGRRFTSHVFQALVWKYDLKNQSQYCWQATEGVLTRYSNDILTFLQRLKREDVEQALEDYRSRRR